jgi:YD repeat-containing protein
MTHHHARRSHFDPQGLMTARQDPFGNETTFSYIDASGDEVADALYQMVDPAGRTTTMGYTDGRLTTITDFAGRVTTLAHDAEGRLTSVTRPDPGGQGSPVLQFTYDADTHLMTAFTDATGRPRWSTMPPARCENASSRAGRPTRRPPR